MSASLHKWMAKKGGGGVGAPTEVGPAGTIPARAVATVLGIMPAVPAKLPLLTAPQGQGSGGALGSPVPVTIISERNEPDAEPLTQGGVSPACPQPDVGAPAQGGALADHVTLGVGGGPGQSRYDYSGKGER